MSMTITYTCDQCGKVIPTASQTRGGTVYGSDVEKLLDSTTWHACDDICLVRFFESLIVKVKARVGKTLDEEKTKGGYRVESREPNPKWGER
jgi:hypothetical protein